jgi:hypothetical protein
MHASSPSLACVAAIAPNLGGALIGLASSARNGPSRSEALVVGRRWFAVPACSGYSPAMTMTVEHSPFGAYAPSSVARAAIELTRAIAP